MAVFEYEALDVRGLQQIGTLECASRLLALEELQRRGLTALTLAERTPGVSTWMRYAAALRQTQGAKLDAKQIAAVTQALAALLRAGLTIDRALMVAAGLESELRSQRLLAGLGKAVRAGRSFAESLRESGLALPPYYIGMVEAGEAGGSLAQALSRLGLLLRRQVEIRERIRSALIYPAMLSAVVLLTIVLLLTLVLPRFEELFAESEAVLPWATRVVLAVGAYTAKYWWAMCALAVLMICGLTAYVRSDDGRERLDTWLLRSRLFRGLPAAIESARLLRTLSTLLANGVPVARATRIARATLSNTRMRKGLDEAGRRITAGESTSSALQAAGVFPRQVVQLARVGEETGRLEELLLEAATILEEESQIGLERLLALLVPALTVAMGLLIAGLIGSVLIGLLSVNELAF